MDNSVYIQDRYSRDFIKSIENYKKKLEDQSMTQTEVSLNYLPVHFNNF